MHLALKVKVNKKFLIKNGTTELLTEIFITKDSDYLVLNITGEYYYQTLTMLAKVVLTISHDNADLERRFGYV